MCSCWFVVSCYSIRISNYWAPLWHCKIDLVQNYARGGWFYCELSSVCLSQKGIYHSVLVELMDATCQCRVPSLINHALLQQKRLVSHFFSGCCEPQVHILQYLLWLALVCSWLKGISQFIIRCQSEWWKYPSGRDTSTELSACICDATWWLWLSFTCSSMTHKTIMPLTAIWHLSRSILTIGFIELELWRKTLLATWKPNRGDCWSKMTYKDEL